MIARLTLALLLAAPALAQTTAAPPAAPPAPPTTTCIDSDRIQGREGESDHSLLFSMFGGTAWRNTVRGTCPGLGEVGRFRILVTEQQGTRLCRGDIVRPVDPEVARHTGARGFAACVLGDFTAVPVPPREFK